MYDIFQHQDSMARLRDFIEYQFKMHSWSWYTFTGHIFIIPHEGLCWRSSTAPHINWCHTIEHIGPFFRWFVHSWHLHCLPCRGRVRRGVGAHKGMAGGRGPRAPQSIGPQSVRREDKDEGLGIQTWNTMLEVIRIIGHVLSYVVSAQHRLGSGTSGKLAGGLEVAEGSRGNVSKPKHTDSLHVGHRLTPAVNLGVQHAGGGEYPGGPPLSL